MASIYISSTYADLKDMREVVYHALRKMRHDVIAMEDYIATDKRPLDKCLADVAQCDIYIGIYAWRYGYIPPDQEKSITELEYREAVRTGKPCLLFLLDEEAPWPIKLTDTDRTRIEAFHNELCENYTVSFFQDANDLTAKVITAMEQIGREKDRSEEDSGKRLEHLLQPLNFEADITPHISRFTGRQWVFDRIDTWLDNTEASRVFWITGKPGVGKTAIAAWLWTNRQEVAAVHFCRYGHEDKVDPRRAILSLACQLASTLPEYQKRLIELENLENIVAKNNAKTLFNNLVVQPLSGDIPKPERSIIILIDALDEASEGDKNLLASSIASEFDKTPEWMRLIITSRPEPEVVYPLQALTPYVLDASTPENEEDIRDFLRRELVSFAGGREPEQKVIDTIIDLSEGVFLYVEWTRKELEQRRLSLDRLDEFPQGLGGIYAQFFERQFPDIKGFEDKYRPVLEIIAAAREPLELDYISSIFEWSVYEHGEIMDTFGSLFPISANRIHPFHKSVLDWLTDRSKAGPYFTIPQEGHKRLADYGWQEYKCGAGSMSQYFIVHLPTHLSIMGRKEDLHKLLLDFGWLQVKLEATDVTSLISDYNHLPDDRNLRMIQSALLLSAHILHQDKDQLASQLLGRLQSFHESEIQSMLEQVRGRKGRIWLRPLTASLRSAGDSVISQEVCICTAVAITPNGRKIVTTSGKNIIIWDMETRVILCTLKGHTRNITAMAITPDGKHIISTSKDRTLKLWDIKTGSISYTSDTLENFTHWIDALVITTDGQLIISASTDNTYKVWKRENLELLDTFYSSSIVWPMALIPDSQYIVSQLHNGTLKIWDIKTGKKLHTLKGHTGGVNTVAITPDNRRAISASLDGTFIVWDMEFEEQLHAMEGNEGTVIAVVITPYGQRTISVDHRTIFIWNTETGEKMHSLDLVCDILAVAIAPDGRRIISALSSGTIKVFDTETGERLYKLDNTYNALFTAVTATPDGRRVISASSYYPYVWENEMHSLEVWDLETEEQLHTLEGHTERINAVTVTPDSRNIVSASNDKTVRIWDIESGRQIRILEGYTGPITDVVVTSDGARAISTSGDTILKVWDLGTGEQILTLEGHTSWINAMAVNNDGVRAISTSDDTTLKVWDLETGEILCTFSGDYALYACAISPDGKIIVAGEGSGRIHFLRLEGEQ